MRYTFGTSDTASNRLEEIARFFNPLSIQFIRKYVQEPVGSVIDLACGPNTEFTQFLFIARGSCGKVRAQQTVAFDQKYIGEDVCKAFKNNP
jgi:hypothetical protein